MIPHLLIQSQVCCRLHHFRMVRPGGSNSDLRGKGPPGNQLPQRRKGLAGSPAHSR
jgi:hypothetical protein